MALAPRATSHKYSTAWMDFGNCAAKPLPDPPPLYSAEQADAWREALTIQHQRRRWEIFYPDSKVSAPEAKAICKDCPVKDLCLCFALVTRQEFGVWGGLTESERRRIPRPVTPPAEVASILLPELVPR